RSSSPLVLIRVLMKLYADLRDTKPDVIIGLQTLSNLAGALMGLFTGVAQRIATHHNPKHHLNRCLTALDSLAGRLGFYTRIVACAESVADTYRGNGAAYTRRLIAIQNGQHAPVRWTRATARERLCLPAGARVVGQIGRLQFQKNQTFTLDLVHALPEAHLLLVGSGPDEIMLHEHAAALGLAARVTFVRSIDPADVGAFYGACDLVVFPSRFEGLSLAAIEAIHCRTPLLCADIPSFREMFRSSPYLAQNAVLPTDDTTHWHERAQALLDDASLRADFVAALDRLSPAYSYEAMAQKYLALIDEVPQRAGVLRARPAP
ncbi:MAG TPA: glycosyltransferase family 4 protein, partial [Paraburkholderia sp.]